ncbi:MAG: dihydrodipicolinate synthase family protein [Planctomycetaceae bacterium]|jgi:4-hydroxy-tetrahydrodipicolinate synthase|nr:dihydrodipicolinate synthase family protein [Planctomycetaceae bacterium]
MTHDSALRDRLKTVHTYAATPFTDDLLHLDLDGFERNVAFLVEHGMQVVAVGGGTGEIGALTVDELETLVGTALRTVDGRALVIACLPGNLGEAIELLGRYERLGVELCLGMPPLVRAKIPSDLSGTWNYFNELGRVTGLPLMPYNTQGWPAEFLVELADIDAIIGVKDPCQVPHEFFRAIQMLGDRFVWVGNKKHDPGVAHLRYQMGMEGFTSGQGNFWPEPELAIHAAGVEGDWDRIIEIQQRVAVLEQLRLAHDDAAMVKVGMDLVGLAGGKVRPPRVDASGEAREAFREALVAAKCPLI